jgi:hypothetical protein
MGEPKAESDLTVGNSCGAAGPESVGRSAELRLRRFPIEGVDVMGSDGGPGLAVSPRQEYSFLSKVPRENTLIRRKTCFTAAFHGHWP